jgi:hypothetical protein
MRPAPEHGEERQPGAAAAACTARATWRSRVLCAALEAESAAQHVWLGGSVLDQLAAEQQLQPGPVVRPGQAAVTAAAGLPVGVGMRPVCGTAATVCQQLLTRRRCPAVGLHTLGGCLDWPAGFHLLCVAGACCAPLTAA